MSIMSSARQQALWVRADARKQLAVREGEGATAASEQSLVEGGKETLEPVRGERKRADLQVIKGVCLRDVF